MKLKNKCIIAVLSVAIGLLQSCTQKENVQGKISINSNWKFKRLAKENASEKGWEAVEYSDADWENVVLPHTSNVEPLVVNNQWQGICWYRKDLNVPNVAADKKIYLEFEGAMNYSKIYINGKFVKEHQGGFLPVVLDVTKHVKKGATNLIAVRLDNTDNLVTGPKPLKRLDFNMFGGLYRNAWMLVKDNVHISHAAIANKVAGGGVFVTYPKVSESESVIKVKTNVVNQGNEDATIQIVNTVLFNGKIIAEETSAKTVVPKETDLDDETNMIIKNAKLWSPSAPNLYTLETKVVKNGIVIDTESNQIGIREFVFKDNQLYINGVKTFLRGMNRHQEYPFIGYALSDNAQYRDAKKIKDAGCNYIRLSHYPQSPAFMQACNELGIVVIDAIMGWQYYGDNDAFRNYCYTSATQLIRRDRNHPCVLAWEVSLNETQMPIFFMEKLHEIVHTEYPGKNVYSCGWMDDVYDIYLQARQHRILHPHELKANQPYSVSEYGDWEYYSKNAGLNQDQLPNNVRDEYSSRQSRADGEERMLRQAYNVQESHNDNLNTKAYSDSYWVMYDYNRGYHPDIEKSGIMDIFRLPKFAYYFYQSQRDVSEGEVLKIASYWNEKSPLDVKVYSNCDEVSLYLNDELIGTQKPDTDKNSTNLKHPPFTFKMKNFVTGTLKAVGTVKGKIVAETKVITPEEVVGLKVWIDESGKQPQAGVNDIVFVYVAAIDKNGTIVPEYNKQVTFNSNENAVLKNVGRINAEAGIATGVLQLGANIGNVVVTAKSGKFTKEFTFKVN
ncbi:glycoside hydrolase family 2 protein [Wenyingzhuangia aestuarii]|uniref:glycoside hydrolase family 2 protein n=1 Tax=Wenyingzhuangia aestuarii TaxID=1647582 RepID=UPI00143BAA38|nr:glycoside hydrolase family 2 TIM barrel-domain containing protein [Wenyingzhuangia aestuarii]NJB83512.1 beta-galactosidase [Wenyingzhuangia aestuarii]